MTSPLFLCLFLTWPLEAVLQHPEPVARYLSMEDASSVLIDAMVDNLRWECEDSRPAMMIYEIDAAGSIEWSRDSLYRFFTDRMTRKDGIDLFDDSYGHYLRDELGLYPADKISYEEITEYAESMAIPYVIGVSIEPNENNARATEHHYFRLVLRVIDGRTRSTVWTGYADFEVRENDPLVLW